MEVADCLNRLPLIEETEDSKVLAAYVVLIYDKLLLWSHIEDQMKQDRFLQFVKNWIRKGWPKMIPKQIDIPEIKAFFKKEQQLTENKDVLP